MSVGASRREFAARYDPGMKLLVTLSRDETGIAMAECPVIRGCVSQGATEAEALANIREAIVGCLAARSANDMPLTVEVREVEVPV
jgi:predicted RNase H-like HicB family nuclease